MIIDFHAHAFADSIAEKAVQQLNGRYGYPNFGDGTVAGLLERSAAAGINLSVIHTAATRPTQVRPANDWAAKLNGGRLVAFGTLHPDYPDIQGEVHRLKDLGLLGIKFHSDFQEFFIDDPKAMAMYEAIGSDFAVLFHVGDRRDAGFIDYATPERLARVIKAFPRLKAVAAHLGGFQMWDEARRHLVGKPIYLDTSSALSLLPVREVLEIVRVHGAERILWGSDYPMWDPMAELSAARSLPLPESQVAAILGVNAQRLLDEVAQTRVSAGLGA